MSGKGGKENRIVDGKKVWVNMETDETLETITVERRIRDNDFIKLFPLFFDLVFAAIKAKKVEGAWDVLFYFLCRLREEPVNAFGRQLDIVAPADEIAKALGKSVRKVRQNLDTLKKIGLIDQVKSGVPSYRIHPSVAYRGILKIYEQRVEMERNAPKRGTVKVPQEVAAEDDGEPMTMAEVLKKMKEQQKHPPRQSSRPPDSRPKQPEPPKKKT